MAKAAPPFLKPFQAHSALMMQAQQFIGGGDRMGGARLIIFGKEIPVTHTEIVADFEVEAGKSSRTFVERAEFMAADVPNSAPVKGVKCGLKPNPDAAPVRMQLWHGGLQPGGEVYRFMLVDEFYKG